MVVCEPVAEVSGLQETGFLLVGKRENSAFIEKKPGFVETEKPGFLKKPGFWQLPSNSSVARQQQLPHQPILTG
jgi:hypothetical protein